MVWDVELHEDFVPEFDALPQAGDKSGVSQKQFYKQLI
jgi:hypothetical protein